MSAFDDVMANIEKLQKENKKYYQVFHKDLVDSGLKDKTIDKHMSNVEFYLDEFAAGHLELNMIEATDAFCLDDFFGYFFIRKCMWSTPATIKETIAGLKKFYKSMLKNGYIEKELYETFIETIKNSREQWIEECRRYNNGEDTMYSDFLF